MLAGCELDAVTVASPPFAHRDGRSHGAAARKHVLCRKAVRASRRPMRATMVEAAKAAGTACGVSHEFRFVPEAAAIKELVANDHLGPLRNIELTLLRSIAAPPGAADRADGGSNASAAAALTGAVLSHLIDHANWLAGRAPRQSGWVLADCESRNASTIAARFARRSTTGRSRYSITATAWSRGSAPMRQPPSNRIRAPSTAKSAPPWRADRTLLDLTLYAVDRRQHRRTRVQTVAVPRLCAHQRQRAAAHGALRRIRQQDRRASPTRCRASRRRCARKKRSPQSVTSSSAMGDAIR